MMKYQVNYLQPSLTPTLHSESVVIQGFAISSPSMVAIRMNFHSRPYCRMWDLVDILYGDIKSNMNELLTRSTSRSRGEYMHTGVPQNLRHEAFR